MNEKRIYNYDFRDFTNVNKKNNCEKFFESLKNPYNVPVSVDSVKAFKFVCESDFKIIKFKTFLNKQGNIRIFNNKIAKKIGSLLCKNLDELYLYISNPENNSFKIMTKNISNLIKINKLVVVHPTFELISKNQMKGLALLLSKIKAKYFTLYAPKIERSVLNVFYKTLYKLNNNYLMEIIIRNIFDHKNKDENNKTNLNRLQFSEIRN